VLRFGLLAEKFSCLLFLKKFSAGLEIWWLLYKSSVMSLM